MKYKTMVVDDEPLARAKLKTFLEGEPDIEFIGEYGSGHEALEAMEPTIPDILLLDIQMPEMTGFDLLANLPPGKTPAVIFVTAYDQYAVQAFEVHAADYLLKPFDRERFQKALTRAKDLLPQRNEEALSQKLLNLLEDLKGRAEPRHMDRVITKSNGRIRILRAEEIDWIEAEGNYVRLHTGNDSHLLRETMNGLEQKLDPKRFVRIHRSTMVNLEQVKELQPWFRGDYVVILKNNKQLTLSRGYRERLESLLGRSL